MSSAALRSNVNIRPQVLERAKERLREAIDKVHKHEVSVGIHASDGDTAKLGYDGKPTQATLIEAALAQEFGLGNAPERSWLRSWVQSKGYRASKEMLEVMAAEYRGDHDAVNRQAKVWAGELRDWIQLQQGGLDELTEATVEKKSAAGLQNPDVPLLATGQLVRAIKAVVDGGAE